MHVARAEVHHRFNMGDITGQYEILKTPVFTGISTFSRHRWRFALSSLGPNFGTRCPHAGPSCARWAQLASKRAHAAPCWTPAGLSWSQQLARVRDKLGPSLAQVGSCSAQLTGKDGQVWPQSALIGPSTPAPYLSIHIILSIPWARAVLVAKRLELF